MKTRKSAAAMLALVALAGAGIACDNSSPEKSADAAPAAMPMKAVPLAAFVAPEDSLPYLRFFDGDQVSLNDRCPVRKVRLNPKMAPAYVNGRPVGFC